MAEHDKTGGAGAFYDALAPAYDEMTAFGQRVENARQFVRELKKRYSPRRVLDVGCGTGSYALACSLEGIPAAGADLSEEMIKKARRNAEAAGVQVDWAAVPMQHLSQEFGSRFDAVLCFGNTLPHLLDEEQLAQALAEFRNVLNPGGHVLLQFLNYEKILSRRDRIVSIDRKGDRQFVRFYDFAVKRDLLRFNLLTVDWRGEEAAHHLDSVLLKPYTASEVQRVLTGCGWRDVNAYGGLSFQPYMPLESETVLVTCHK